MKIFKRLVIAEAERFSMNENLIWPKYFMIKNLFVKDNTRGNIAQLFDKKLILNIAP